MSSWYEVIHPVTATTEVVAVMDDGSIYSPDRVVTEGEFAFAAARGNVHRLVREADVIHLSDPEAGYSYCLEPVTLIEAEGDDRPICQTCHRGAMKSVRSGWCPCAAGRPQHCSPEKWPLSRRHGTKQSVALSASIRSASLFESAWDEGNAFGLDGWIGPERGTEADPEAIARRERTVDRLVDELRARIEGLVDQS